MNIGSHRRLASCSAAALMFALAAPCAALAQPATYSFDIPAQDLGAALRAFAQTAHQQISFAGVDVQGKQNAPLVGAFSADDALRLLLQGSGLHYRRTPTGVFVVASDQAAAPPPPPQEVEAVVVTGTNIRGGVTASPKQVYDRRAIDQSGHIDTESFVNALPQNFAGTNSSASVSARVDPRGDAQAGESGANLHGLGSRATLVLIDGHRMAPADFGAFTDLNAVPLSAVDHVDVLTDGGSALYGTDAVAGVINFVLRKRLSGAETQMDVGGVTKGGMRQDRFAQTVGLDWAGGSGILSYNYSDQTALRAYSRSFTPPALQSTDLEPRQFIRNLFAHGTQTLSDRLDIYGTGLATHRTSTDSSPVLGSEYTDADEVMLIGGARYRLNRAWDADLSVSSSGFHERAIQRYGHVLIGDIAENTETTSGEALINGRLFSLPAGDIKTAFGGELRRETFGDRNNNRGVPKRGARNVGALFAELNIPVFSSANAAPLLQELTFTAAGRWEHYSDFGDTTNPQFGLRWKPEHELLFRATAGTSFHAPTLNEQTGIEQSIPFPVFDPTAPGMISNALIVLGVKTPLRPETSHTKTIGADYQPDWAPGLKLTATWFETRYSNRIAAPPGSPFSYLANPTFYQSVITRNPTLAQINAVIAATQFFNPFGIPSSNIQEIVNGAEQNLASEDVRGWDFGADYHHALGAGEATISFNGEHMDSFSVKLTPTASPTDVTNTAYNPPSWRTRTNVSWTWREFSFAGALNTVGSYTDNLVTPNKPVKAYNTVDSQISYRFSDTTQPLSGLQLSLSIINLFDTQPPAVAGAQSGYDPTNASPLGRVWTVSLRKRW